MKREKQKGDTQEESEMKIWGIRSEALIVSWLIVYEQIKRNEYLRSLSQPFFYLQPNEISFLEGEGKKLREGD